jgi:cobyrinic acid a,c-diamide synthase
MTQELGRGVIIAAPSSGSGKTTITLGLLRALAKAGVPVRAAKSGPDYIDVRFHEAACGARCVNLDAWAMTPERIARLASLPGFLIIEGAMGLFDGAPPNGKGACADLAQQLNLPVVLVVDASKMAQSVVPIVNGFATHDADVRVAGVILNKVGSDRHEKMLRDALKDGPVPVLGVVRRDRELSSPSRHLGLVQAQELPQLEALLDHAADVVSRGIDLDAFQTISGLLPVLPPLEQPAQAGRRMALAKDAAFDFAYRHLIDDFKLQGWHIETFSPLANEPVPNSDLIFLPGGYPELFAERLAGNDTFLNSLKNAAQDTEVYGECGGYMVLGDSLIDADGVAHEMAGLLPLATSFAERKLHLGYRDLSATAGPFAGHSKGHEFHYATTLHAEGEPLYRAKDAEGTSLPDMGLRRGNVCGSFAHVIEWLPLSGRQDTDLA